MSSGPALEYRGQGPMVGKKERDDQVSKKERGWRKMKGKKDRNHGSDNGDRSIHSEDRKHSIEMEQAEVLGEMAEEPCYGEGVMCKSNAKKDRKKKKKDKGFETATNKQILDAAAENVVSEYAERNKGKGKHESKSKEGNTATDGSAWGQIVSGEQRRRKRKEECSVSLVETNNIDMSKIWEKRGSKKKRGESGNVGLHLSHCTWTGDVEHGNDEKMKGKDENQGGKREKERKDKGKRVSFTDDVEVFGIDGVDDKEGDGSSESGLVHGRRFTQEESATLLQAITDYIEMKQLGENGLEMIRHCGKHPEVRGCWKEIAKSLPHRPRMAIYLHARTLLSRSAERKYTPEEFDTIRRFVEENGPAWTKLAKQLGKSDRHVKDAWRRLKPKNLKKGPWSQDEYQNLFDLVNLDLRMKAGQKVNSDDHRQLRNNISWEAISEKLTTRSDCNCCLKWYQYLASPMVKQGIWADIDDYLLVEALQKVDAVCVEEVDWENLLDHRSGELCRQRWNQLLRVIGGHREKPFIEQVEVLSRRYTRETLDRLESPLDEPEMGQDM